MIIVSICWHTAACTRGTSYSGAEPLLFRILSFGICIRPSPNCFGSSQARLCSSTLSVTLWQLSQRWSQGGVFAFFCTARIIRTAPLPLPLGEVPQCAHWAERAQKAYSLIKSYLLILAHAWSVDNIPQHFGWKGFSLRPVNLRKYCSCHFPG